MIPKSYISKKITPSIWGFFMSMIKSLILKIKSWFVKSPTKKLTWNQEDFEMGKRWALSTPHPFKKGLTMWDFVYDHRDSTLTINNINNYLFS